MKKKPPIISSLAIIITLLTGILVISGWFTNNDFLKAVAPIAFFVFLSAFFILLVTFLFSIRNNITKSKDAEVNIKSTSREIPDYKYALNESSIVVITDKKGTHGGKVRAEGEVNKGGNFTSACLSYRANRNINQSCYERKFYRGAFGRRQYQ